MLLILFEMREHGLSGVTFCGRDDRLRLDSDWPVREWGGGGSHERTGFRFHVIPEQSGIQTRFPG